MLVRKLIITRVIVHLPAEDAAQPATVVSAPATARRAGAGAALRPCGGSGAGSRAGSGSGSSPGSLDDAQLMSEQDLSFPSMGSDARVVVDGAEAEPLRAFLLAYERRLTRFDPASELCMLNRSPAHAVAASPLLRRAVRAGLWAAERSGGLVDPTLLPELEAAGYDRSRRSPELALADALRDAPPRAAAAPDPRARWRTVAVDDDSRRRAPATRRARSTRAAPARAWPPTCSPPGFAATDRFAIDCGGDIRVGGVRAGERPFEVLVRHPLTGESLDRLQLTAGGIATSGLDVRLWRDAHGRPAHHLLDPSTGRPAWTGLIGATALAPTALEAETLAKTALLSGRARARRLLARHGGLRRARGRRGGTRRLPAPARGRALHPRRAGAAAA